MKIFKMRILFLLILFCLPIIFGLQNRIQADSGDLVKINKKAEIVNPQKRDINQELILAGLIDTDQKSVVKFQTSGKLAWVGVKVGDRVKKGQSLASLDKVELQKSFQKQANDFLSAYHTFHDVQDEYQDERDKHLVTDEIQRILNRAQHTLNNAVIDYEISELAVKYATIHSPINGIVTTTTDPLAGVNIVSVTTSFTIVDPDSIYFSAEVDQEDVVDLNPGQSATIYLDSFVNSDLKSTINHISFEPIAGVSSTVYEVRLKLDLDNSNLSYRLGMSGDVIVPIAQSKDALSLPVEAVKQDNGQPYVLVQQDKKQAKKVNINTGLENDDYIEILDRLTQNDQIVIQ